MACLVGGGTLLQGALTLFALEFFANTEDFWLIMVRTLPAQLLCNLLAGYLLRNLYQRWLRTAPGRFLQAAVGLR